MKELLNLCGKEFEIRRNSRRKRIAIGVDANGNWFIGTPDFYSRERLVKILSANENITGLIEKLEKRPEEIPPARVFAEGECLFFQGEKYPLRWVYEPSAPPLELRDNAFCLSSLRMGREDETLELWYARQLYHILRELLPLWSKRLGVSPRKISIKRVTTLWGSCSHKNNITFSTRLALVPPELLEYVVVHELTHMKHMNHSAQFWQELEKHLPDGKERRASLKKNGQNYKWW